MPNWNSVKTKSSCDRRSSNTSTSEKHSTAKKVIPKKSIKCCKDGKCTSMGVISSHPKPPVVKPKKTTRSAACFMNKTTVPGTVIDYCKNCGDAYDASSNDYCNENYTKNSNNSGDANEATVSKSNSDKSICKKKREKLRRSRVLTEHKEEIKTDSNNVRHSRDNSHKNSSKRTVMFDQNELKTSRSRQTVKQYYKNENFHRSSDSSQDLNMHKFLKKASNLDTIKELPEAPVTIEEFEDGSREEFRIFEDTNSSDEVMTVIDPDDYDSLRKLREFREDNYFECHSIKARTKHKASTSSMVDHKCVYRFFLNDRLFPEPLNTDHHKNIRCTECHLPLDLSNKDSNQGFKDINGTIQAKVKLGTGDKAQDMVLMLPVKEPLIIREKRKDKKQKQDKEFVYFGVIKLDSYGNSIFNKTLPTDSLALKYQKGYKEFDTTEDIVYKETEEADIIVI